MCGILGCSELNPLTRRIIPHLAWMMEDRGKDSWGATDGVNVVKELGPVTATFGEHLDEILGWDRCILHTRAASHGVASIPNAHPFEFIKRGDHGEAVRRIIGIHNGVVTNCDELDRKYTTFPVDSQHIFHHIAQGTPCDDIYGWGALAWYDYRKKNSDGALRLLRFNSENLHVVRLTTGELLFASTKESLDRACSMAGAKIEGWFTILEEHVFTVVPGAPGQRTELLKSEKRFPFGLRGNTPARYMTGTYGFSSNNTTVNVADAIKNVGASMRNANACVIIGCGEKVGGSRRNYLLCPKHFGQVKEATDKMLAAEEAYVPA